MASSNYSHQLKQHQVRDLEEMAHEISTLSDLAYTIWHAMIEEYGQGTASGAQYDVANRTFDLAEKLKAFTEERKSESEALDNPAQPTNGTGDIHLLKSVTDDLKIQYHDKHQGNVNDDIDDLITDAMKLTRALAPAVQEVTHG